MKIAALVNASGKTISLNDNGQLVLYEKSKDKSWIQLKNLSYYFPTADNIAAIQKSLKNYINALDDCHIILVKDCKAIYRLVFSEANYHIWTADDLAENLLEQILTLENNNDKEKNITKEKTAADYYPVEKQKDHYYIDITEVIFNSSIHSSDVLIPFLEKKNFKVLEIDCTHTPRWLNNIHKTLNLALEEQYTSSGLMKVFVTPLIS